MTLTHDDKLRIINRMLDGIIDYFTIIYDTHQQHYEESMHYEMEFLYMLRGLTNELKQHLSDGFFSLEYIDEKLSKMYDCAVQIEREKRSLKKKKCI